MTENGKNRLSASQMPEGFLALIEGGFGSGKSLMLMERFWEDYQDGYRLFVTNAPLHLDKCQEAMPEAKIVVATNEEMGRWWVDYPKQAVIGCDESHLVFKGRKWQSLLNSDTGLENYVSEIRHDGDRVYLLTQRFKDLPTFFRDRVQLVWQVFRLPFVRPKMFLRRRMEYSGGKRQSGSLFPKLVTFRSRRQFAQMYDTRARTGLRGNRDAAAFELPKRGSAPKWLIYGSFAALLGWVGWRHRPVDTPRVPAASEPGQVVASVSSGQSPGRLPNQVGRKKLEYSEGVYTSSLGDVLGVEGDDVLVGSHGRNGEHAVVLKLPRDLHAEYAAVRSQVKDRSGRDVAGESSRGVERAGGGAADIGGSNVTSFLPVRAVH